MQNQQQPNQPPQPTPSIPSQLYILYSTQTGNSYQLANLLTLSLHLPQNPIELSPQFQFQPGALYVIFVSTTGQGDPPYGMRQFWRKIMRKGYRELGGVRFCVYGLGDRAYGENFNVVARKVRQRLIMLKAEEVVTIGLGDQQDSNGCFDQYFKVFYPSLQKYLSEHPIKINKTLTTNPPLLPHPKLTPTHHSLTLKKSHLLSSTTTKKTYLITLQIPQPQPLSPSLTPHKIIPGNILQIFPHNSQQIVNEMLKYFIDNGLDDVGVGKQELEEYLRTVANLGNFVNFSFFRGNAKGEKGEDLGDMIDGEVGGEIRELFVGKLKQLGEDYDEYYNYIRKYRRNILQVITDFSLKIPLSAFTQRISHIIPRKYSISKITYPNPSTSTSGCQIQLLIKLQKYQISSNRVVNGLCSHDLCLWGVKEEGEGEGKLGESGTMRMGRILRGGEFQVQFQDQREVGIVMISLGTGIAPFLSIIDQAQKNKSNWQLTLFHSTPYLSQFPLLHNPPKNPNLTIFLTTTRQTPSSTSTPSSSSLSPYPTQTRRLQFIIKDNLPIIQKCKNGKIMICGAKEFCEIVCRIFQEELGFQVKKMKKDKIICVENW